MHHTKLKKPETCIQKTKKKRKGKKQKHSNLHVEVAQLIDVWLMPRSTGHKAPTKSKHARETTSKSDSKQKRLHCTEQARSHCTAQSRVSYNGYNNHSVTIAGYCS